MSWDLDTKLGLAYQGYHSDEIVEELLASDLEAALLGRSAGNWESGLRIAHREDLYTVSSRAIVDFDYLGESLGLDGEVLLERSEPGRLNDPLLWFDPDDLASQYAADAGYQRSGLRTGLSWSTLGWDGRLGASWSDQRYDEPSEALSDSREGRVESALGLSLPAEGRLDLDASFREETYEQRPASDEQELSFEGRASFPLGESWEGALLGELRHHAVRDETGIAYYERPSGRERAFGFGLDSFGAGRGELSLETLLCREEWSDYDGYFGDGWGKDVEAMAGLSLGEDSRLDLFCAAAFFDPDSIQTDTWTLRRVTERRLEADLFLRHGSAGSFPIGLGVIGERLLLRGEEEDRFLLLQGELELGWRPDAARSFRVRVSLDQYQSLYAGEEEETEWGWSGSVEFRLERGPWELESRLERQQRYSFLEDSGPIEDWETGLEIRWHP